MGTGDQWTWLAVIVWIFLHWKWFAIGAVILIASWIILAILVLKG